MLAVGAWRLIIVLSDVASLLRSLNDLSPFSFYITFVDFDWFRMALIFRSTCVMVGFVM